MNTENNKITKLSEITIDDIKSYIRLTEIDKEEEKYLKTILEISLSFIKNYTGLSKEEMDKYSDLIIVAYVLCQDMYDNRSFYVDKSELNNVVSTILNMHARNLL